MDETFKHKYHVILLPVGARMADRIDCTRTLKEAQAIMAEFAAWLQQGGEVLTGSKSSGQITGTSNEILLRRCEGECDLLEVNY